MDNGKRKKAEERVKEIKGFYINIVHYVIINVILVIINLITSPGALWFYWVSIFWGIAIIMQGVNVFVGKGKLFGKEWEEKKIKELTEKE